MAIEQLPFDCERNLIGLPGGEIGSLAGLYSDWQSGGVIVKVFFDLHLFLGFYWVAISVQKVLTVRNINGRIERGAGRSKVSFRVTNIIVCFDKF